ncbi:MAG: cytochrome P450 [Anaerolineales bacterium]|nr:cytochrome P450 [Anaerolineales bacterium]
MTLLKSNRASHLAPPGPGRLIPLSELRALRDDPLSALVAIAERYGDIFSYPIAFQDIYVLNHPDHIEHVLVTNQKNYNKNTFQFNLLKAVTGNGLLASDGDYWRKQRRLIQPAFHKHRLERLGPIAVEASDRLLARWQSAIATGEVVDVEQAMLRVALEILGEALFSNDMRGDAATITRAVMVALDHIAYRARNPFAPPRWLPTRRNRRVHRAMQTLDDAVATLLSQRRRSTDRPDDLLTMLIEARDVETGEPMSDQQLRDELVTLLIAGHETVASALTWSWHLLATHPAALAALQSELATQLGGAPPTLDALANLPYTRAIFDEAMRLFPPNWIITRRAEQADEIGGYTIKAGSMVLISPYLTQRDPQLWDRPNAFDPSRFMPEAPRPSRFAYFPFGSGTRLCIGKHFSLIEGPLVIATLAQKVTMRAVNPTPHAEALVTIRPQGGLPMTIAARSQG